jgi:F-box/leucine-rich repeat protein 2/20
LDTSTYASNHRKSYENALERIRVLSKEHLPLSASMAVWLNRWAIVPAFLCLLHTDRDENALQLVRWSRLEGCSTLQVMGNTSTMFLNSMLTDARPVRSLQHMVISKLSLSLDEVSVLFRRFPALQTLRVGYYGGAQNTFHTIFQNCPLLTDVHVHSTSIDDVAILSLTRNCPHLAALTLVNGHSLTDASMVAVGLHSKRLTKLEILGLKCEITDYGVSMVCGSCALLATVALEGTRATAASFGALVEHCRANLVSLKLTAFAQSPLPATSLRRMIELCAQLRVLHVTWQQLSALADVVVPMKHLLTALRSLTVSGRSGADVNDNDSIVALTKACLELHELCLVPDCVLAEETWLTLASGCATLQTLHLSRCETLTDTFVLGLVATNASLRSLTLLAAGNLTDASLLALSRHCPALTALGLPHCPLFTDDAVVELVTRCSQLHLLMLNSSENLSDAFMQALAQHGRQLRTLNLADCPNFSDAAVRAMSDHCRRLEQLWVSAEVLSYDQAKAVERDHSVRALVVTRVRSHVGARYY